MIQCNASNQWGYVFADVFLNVLAQPPSFMVPAQTIVSAEGQSVTLDCSVYSVKPVRIGWMKGSQQLTSGGRQVILPNGNLVIGVRIHRFAFSDISFLFCTFTLPARSATQYPYIYVIRIVLYYSLYW